MWMEALLVIIILILLAWSLFSGGGAFKVRRLSADVKGLQGELARIRAVNDALRASLDGKESQRVKSLGDMCELARDFECLRSAIAGSSPCQKILSSKYGAQPSPELVDRILTSKPGVDLAMKRRLANELLVGEVGRDLLHGLAEGKSIEQTAGDADIPVVVARGQIKRLQVLGYLDDRLELTERGREALA